MKSVLIVDDSRVSRKILRNILEHNGYAVAGEAIDGNEAVDLYKKLNPDFVTMDITMPSLNGIEALKQIKDYDPDAKIIIVTAAGQQEKRDLAKENGAAHFVTKPYDYQEIIDALEH